MNIKNRIKLAKKGHKLLKQKRDALILEFFKILEKAKDLRGELNGLMASAYISMSKAQAHHSTFELENVSLSVKKSTGVNVETRNIMGVNIPIIEGTEVSKPLTERGYSILGTSAKIDEVAESFEKALDMVVKLAETENALKRLIREIEKTKRRVNALEYVMLPRLDRQKKMIMLRLDEMERDSFVMLKTIKRKLSKKGQEEREGE
ncbi:V-type ATP synthase subunit D [Candidatus Gugararchaeum adminiculabundum]|nr:V-type ATP synthase subunit D [Candidatus Gugararchaeum adminiculabundum]